jgi:hypothetical protein
VINTRSLQNPSGVSKGPKWGAKQPFFEDSLRAALSRASFVDPGCSEKAVRILDLIVALNDRSDDIGCNAAVSVLRLQADAASANPRKGNGGFVRIADLDGDRSESPVSADSVEKQRVAGAESGDLYGARAPFLSGFARLLRCRKDLG